MTTIADNLMTAAASRGLDIHCRITPVFRLVRIDCGNVTRVVRTACAARILAALRDNNNNDPREIIRVTK